MSYSSSLWSMMEDGDSSIYSNTDATICNTADLCSSWGLSLISDPNMPDSSSSMSIGDDLIVSGASSRPFSYIHNIMQTQNQKMEVEKRLDEQLEVKRRLDEQLEVQRYLQLRMESQGKYLKKIIEEQQQLGHVLSYVPSSNGPESETRAHPATLGSPYQILESSLKPPKNQLNLTLSLGIEDQKVSGSNM